jgi:hypothetical protein
VCRSLYFCEGDHQPSSAPPLHPGFRFPQSTAGPFVLSAPSLLSENVNAGFGFGPNPAEEPWCLRWCLPSSLSLIYLRSVTSFTVTEVSKMRNFGPSRRRRLGCRCSTPLWPITSWVWTKGCVDSWSCSLRENLSGAERALRKRKSLDADYTGF